MAGQHQGKALTARRGIAAVVLALALSGSAIAQQSASIEPDAAPDRAAYEQVLREMKLSSERIDGLAAEIDGVRKDYATITAALIQSAKTEQKLARDIDDITTRLDRLGGEEAALRSSLSARRGVLAEVLAALQRMGLNPPPAILVTPEDALSSVRSAILLGAVVPELREQTEILMADMAEMTRVKGSIAAERDRLMAAADEQMSEKQRLELLLAAKRALQAKSRAEMEAEQKRSEELAAKAGSLRELITQLDRQAEAERSAADEQAMAEKAERERQEAIAALPENNRTLVSLPFDALKGQLALPVTGKFAKRFGGHDDNGGVMQGDTLATQSAAIVTAPADGSVLYAGPFRSYGQLLILDAGNGYHVVLAGLDRINIGRGQTVLAGEPIGAMGEARVASTSAKTVANGPELYVEFRKDGKPVDPGPWWAAGLSGRT
jgi:septal ring factor EnvC (AmiA/AmiB activator)